MSNVTPMTVVGDAEAVVELEVVEEAFEDVEELIVLEVVEFAIELVELIVLEVVEFVYIPLELLLLDVDMDVPEEGESVVP